MLTETAAVQLMGNARATLGSTIHPFLQDQRYQLLAYLAFRGDWASREGLARLFYAESAHEAARDKLRHLVGRARALRFAPGLEVERERLRWAVDTDVAAFAQAVGEGRWADALALHAGPLLPGLEGDTGGFAEWLELERDRLHAQWRTALSRRAEELAREGRHLEAAEVLAAGLRGPELDEEALLAYANALVRAGERGRARRAYEGFVERLREEYDLTPTAELERLGRFLAQEVEAGPPPPRDPGPAPVPARAGSLPVTTTSFVGRDLELAEIARLLAQPDCRLLTLVGPGGVGKTRLALEAARALAPDYPDGAFFVSLEALGGSALVPNSIADALGISLQGQADPLAQVVRYVGGKRMLIVLDNFEHLLDGAGVALRLVERCPNLRLIVTSRERLSLEPEWLLAVEGLDYPDEADFGAGHGRYFDAVGLFLERARRVRLDFAPGDADMPHLLSVCRLVEGSPLGLELAAVWVRLLPPSEIATQIEENLDFLSAARVGKTERHASLRAVFEHSWRLLTPLEQETFRKLAVFTGGFRLEAARLVAGASLPVLAALVDKSLLRVSPKGRYDRHALVHQYAKELLAQHPGEETRARDRHGRYYLGFLAERCEAIQGPGGAAALAALDEELQNVRAAWGWATEGGRVEELRPAAVHAVLYFNVRSRQHEGFALYGEAARALGRGGLAGAARVALGEVLIRQAWFAQRLGRHEEARALGERGLALVPPGSLSATHGHNTLGVIAERSGDYAEAARRFGEALALAERLGLEARQITLRRNLATLETTLGRLDEAERHVERLSALSRRLDYRFGIFDGPYTQGHLALTAGRLAEAKAAYERSLALARELDFRSEVPGLLCSLATVAHERGEFDEARRLGEEGLAQARASGDLSVEAAALNVLGRASAAVGDDEEARAHLAEALRLAQTSRQTPQILESLVYLAEWRLARGRAMQAAPLPHLILSHPSASHRLKVLAGRLLDAVRPQLSLKALAEVEARGEPGRLEVLADEAQASLEREPGPDRDDLRLG